MKLFKIANFAVLGLVLLAQVPSEAISLRFKSKIFSSGEDIYACNAGVATVTPPSLVCYFGGKKAKENICTEAKTCSNAKENCSTPCKCPSFVGAANVNQIGAYGEDYTPNNKKRALPINLGSRPAYSAAFSPSSTYYTQADSFNHSITNVYTAFSAEIYTGSYFIDICYRGTKLPGILGQIATNTEVTAIPFSADNGLTSYPLDNDRTGLTIGGGSYLDLSDLTVQVFRVCGNSVADTVFTTDGQGIPMGGPNFALSEEMELKESLLKIPLGHDLPVQKFCKVRYVFKETNWKSELPNFRNNDLEGAEVCTWTDITDPRTKLTNSAIH